jgi:hypothetical protein
LENAVDERIIPLPPVSSTKEWGYYMLRTRKQNRFIRLLSLTLSLFRSQSDPDRRPLLRDTGISNSETLSKPRSKAEVGNRYADCREGCVAGAAKKYLFAVGISVQTIKKGETTMTKFYLRYLRYTLATLATVTFGLTPN